MVRFQIANILIQGGTHYFRLEKKGCSNVSQLGQKRGTTSKTNVNECTAQSVK